MTSDGDDVYEGDNAPDEDEEWSGADYTPPAWYMQSNAGAGTDAAAGSGTAADGGTGGPGSGTSGGTGTAAATATPDDPGGGTPDHQPVPDRRAHV